MNSEQMGLPLPETATAVRGTVEADVVPGARIAWTESHERLICKGTRKQRLKSFRVKEELATHCHRIEIAGSIRRDYQMRTTDIKCKSNIRRTGSDARATGDGHGAASDSTGDRP